MLHSPGVPVVLARSFVALSPHTGSTAETVLWTYAMPAGLMGANGSLRIRSFFNTITSSANTKTFRVRMGAAAGGLAGTVMAASSIHTTITLAWMWTEIYNRNNAAIQFCNNVGQRTTDQLITGLTFVAATRDTATAQDIVITAQLSNSGEALTPEGYIIELIRGA